MNGGPQNNMPVFKCPEPVNVTLLGKRVAADVIELRSLRWRDHSGLSRWFLNPMASVLVTVK